MSDKSVHDWRACVISSDLPATTRHVLITLSLHMSVWGESCYPTIAQISHETGLGKTAVINHLKKAEQLGWLVKTMHGYRGQVWRNHEYKAAKPDGVVAVSWKQTEAYRNTHKNGPRERPVKPLRRGSSGEPLAEKVVHLNNEGGSPDDKKVVHEVVTSIPSFSTPSSVPLKDKRKRDEFIPPEFIPPDLWAAYLISRKEKKHLMNSASLTLCVAAIEKCVDAGVDVEVVLTRMIEAGWRSCQPDWFKDSPSNFSSNKPQTETPAEKGERFARERQARLAAEASSQPLNQEVISEQ